MKVSIHWKYKAAETFDSIKDFLKQYENEPMLQREGLKSLQVESSPDIGSSRPVSRTSLMSPSGVVYDCIAIGKRENQPIAFLVMPNEQIDDYASAIGRVTGRDT